MSQFSQGERRILGAIWLWLILGGGRATLPLFRLSFEGLARFRTVTTACSTRTIWRRPSRGYQGRKSVFGPVNRLCFAASQHPHVLQNSFSCNTSLILSVMCAHCCWIKFLHSAATNAFQFWKRCVGIRVNQHGWHMAFTIQNAAKQAVKLFVCFFQVLQGLSRRFACLARSIPPIVFHIARGEMHSMRLTALH